MKLAYVVAALTLIASPTIADDIKISITGKTERAGFDGLPICELQYDITNGSTGTLYYLTVSIDGWDDRGEKLDELLSASLSNNGGLSGKTALGVGSTASFKMDMGFKVRCQYLAKVGNIEVKPEYCNIRMLPENVDCQKMIQVSSKISDLIVED
jgi:hypothetical protein